MSSVARTDLRAKIVVRALNGPPPIAWAARNPAARNRGGREYRCTIGRDDPLNGLKSHDHGPTRMEQEQHHAHQHASQRGKAYSRCEAYTRSEERVAEGPMRSTARRRYS